MKFVRFLFLVILFACCFLILPEAVRSESGYQFVTKWGSGGDRQLRSPSSIAIDTSGNIYVTDTANNRIQKFNSSGVFITKWGSPGSGDGQFKNPRGIAVDTSGNVYVADASNNRIQKFSTAGVLIAKLGSQGAGNGQFKTPSGIAVDASRNVSW